MTDELPAHCPTCQAEISQARGRWVEYRCGGTCIQPRGGDPKMTELNVPEGAWEDNALDDKPGTRLYCAGVSINGVPFHLDAIEVLRWEGEARLQVPVDPRLEHDLDSLYDLTGAGAPLRTITIKGREYVVFATPHSG